MKLRSKIYDNKHRDNFELNDHVVFTTWQKIIKSQKNHTRKKDDNKIKNMLSILGLWNPCQIDLEC